MRSPVVAAVILGLLLGCSSGKRAPSTTAPSATDEPAVGKAVYVGNELIRDYEPVSTLVTPITHVDKPRYPAVDFHCHWTAAQEPAFLLRKMDDLGIAYAVNLSGGSGSPLQAMLDRFGPPSHGRLITFANIDFTSIDDPDFPSHTAAALESAFAHGARGLKIFKNLGLTIRDRSGKLVAVDDPRLDLAFETCGRLGMPVLIHSGDPLPFFQPIDALNERWTQLKRHPDWSFADRSTYPTWDDVIAQRNRLIARHPKTTFVVAHMAEAGNDYATLAGWLDAMPNMYIDISGREAEIGRQPFASRRFFIQYADRILFGTDRYPGRPDQPRYKPYYRILETSDEYFDYFDNGFAPTGEWKVYGLNLPNDVLEKIYSTNALRLLHLAQ
ncbi:MAG: amidohydrolase family protein [Tepidisphaeraceae bacterium]